MTVDTQVDLAVCDKSRCQMTVRQVKASTENLHNPSVHRLSALHNFRR